MHIKYKRKQPTIKTTKNWSQSRFHIYGSAFGGDLAVFIPFPVYLAMSLFQALPARRKDSALGQKDLHIFIFQLTLSLVEELVLELVKRIIRRFFEDVPPI